MKHELRFMLAVFCLAGTDLESGTIRVPDDVEPGSQTREDYVHFGVYRSRDM